MNQNLRNFWKNLKKKEDSFHPFKKNKDLVFFGEELFVSSYQYIHDRIKKLPKIDPYSSFFNILNIEKDHEKTLCELSKKIVSEAFDIPLYIMETHLDEEANVELNQTDEKEKYNYEELSDELKKQINKRILLNSIIQGSSIYSFYTLHHLAKKELNQINPNLIPLYDSFSVGSVASYYENDYSVMLNDARMAKRATIGSARVEYEEKPKVIVYAKSFPVLCQELIKGSMEVISLHSFQGFSAEDLKKICCFADQRVDEPRYIQIGTEVWRKTLAFLKFYKDYGEINIPEFVMKLCLLNPNELENFYEFVFQNEFKEAIEQL